MITVEHLSYTYPGTSLPTLKDLNFNIGKGEVFGFLGPSGAGKSTVQKILYKILTNYKGEITIDGSGLSSLGLEYKQRIGVGFELPNHYEKLTARENLRYFGSFYKVIDFLDVDELLVRVGLYDDRNKKVENYSKGMKMRLNFIRAIQHNPDIIFLDEPTAGLDPTNATIVKQIIKDLRDKGKTVFITTHNMFTADELCDKVAFIVEGKIEKIGIPEELKAEYGQKVVKVSYTNAKSLEFSIEALYANPDFLKALSSPKLQGIHTQEASLEEVFLAVTGKRLK